jgi:hypothetical protein
MRIVDNAVEDGIGEGGMADYIVPAAHWELTGDQGCASAVTTAMPAHAPKRTSPRASLRADSFCGLPAQARKQTELHQVQFGLTPSSRPRRHARLASCICSSAVENLTGKRVGKRFRPLFTFKIDPTNITRNLPETYGLVLHVIKPRSHLAHFMGQFSCLYSYFDNVEHEPLFPAGRVTCLSS